ncbi:hypothetical protein BH11PLA2_BH11PLA2_49370 [soil metagenome]
MNRLTLRRLFATSVLSLAVLGCNDAIPNPKSDPGPVTPKDAPGLIESFRPGAAFNATGRLFKGLGILSLPQIHEQYVTEFTQVPNHQGVGRMRRWDPTMPSRWIELEEDPSIDPLEPPKAAPPSRPGKEIAKGVSFYNSETGLLVFHDGKSLMVRERAWNLTERQLISTEKETGPAAYILEQDRLNMHQRMAAKNAPTGDTTPTRPLTEFEKTAHGQLRDGQQLVVKTTAHDMKLFGAIRAGNTCLSCHKVQEGALLGAFTYTLTPQTEATPVADKLKNLDGLTAVEVKAVEAIEAFGGKLVRKDGQPITEAYLSHSRNAEILAIREIDTVNAHDGRRINGATLQSTPVMRSAIRNTALVWLKAFPELQVLDLSNSDVTDAAIKDITKLKQLKTIDVTNSRMTQHGIDDLKKALPGCEVLFKKATPTLVP